MKWLNVKTGIKQRMNDILGHNDNIDDGALNAWSIQALMLDNMRRINKALVGNNLYGRPMRGLVISGSNGSYSISPGIGITNNGDIIVVEASLRISCPSIRHIFLQHSTGVATTGGLSSDIIGRAGRSDLVYDDLSAAMGTNVLSDSVVVLSLTKNSDTKDDVVYLGSADLYTPTNVEDRAFGPHDGSDTTVGGIKTIGDISCGTLTSTHSVDTANASISDTLSLGADAIIKINNNTIPASNTIQVRDQINTLKTLTFHNGLLVSIG